MSSSLSWSYDTSTQLVTMTSILDSNSSGTFNFTVSGITNPISTASVTGIEIKTFGDDDGEIDTGSGSWNIPNPATITGMSFSASGSTVVSELTEMRVLFTLPFPIEADPVIKFTFPDDLEITSDLTGYSGIGLFQSGSTFSTKTSSVVEVPGSTTATSANETNFIRFSSIRNPNKIKTIFI